MGATHSCPESAWLKWRPTHVWTILGVGHATMPPHAPLPQPTQGKLCMIQEGGNPMLPTNCGERARAAGQRCRTAPRDIRLLVAVAAPSVNGGVHTDASRADGRRRAGRLSCRCRSHDVLRQPGGRRRAVGAALELVCHSGSRIHCRPDVQAVRVCRDAEGKHEPGACSAGLREGGRGWTVNPRRSRCERCWLAVGHGS